MRRAWLLLLPVLLYAQDASQQCGACHTQAAQSVSPMGQALHTARESDILKSNPEMNFREGPFSYSVRRSGDSSIFSVTDGRDTFTATLGWAFGVGEIGQTFVYEQGGSYYEAPVSYYSSIRSLDITPGHIAIRRQSLDEARGRKVDPVEIRRCFGCHTTSVVWQGGTRLVSVRAGISCDRCHEGSAQHIRSMTAPGAAIKPMAKLSRLSTEDLSNACGKCHRTWDDIAANGPKGVGNVRFQPYRLTNSKCYDVSDKRIACTACHDPHVATPKDLSLFDAKCRACHAPLEVVAKTRAPKLCPVDSKNCVSCHMPKIDIPGMHHPFTDHYIRVAREGDPYPD